MVRQIVPAHDKRVQVTIEVPQKGKKKPLRFIAPRYEFMPIEDSDAFTDWLNEFFKEPDPKPEGWTQPVLTENQMMDFWIRQLDPEDKEALLGLTLGEKKQIWEIWQEESTAPLGGSEPSENG